MIVTIKLIYNIGDEVYHKTSESPKGIVTAWRYHSENKKPEYLIAFGHLSSDTVWCDDIELSKEIRF